jgi:hypothetical protein
MSQNQSIHSHSQNVIGSQSSAILSIFDGIDDVDDDDDCLNIYNYNSDEDINYDDDTAAVGEGDKREDDDYLLEEGEELEDIMSNKQTIPLLEYL